MSEFKFACPVCGQHITADSKTSGSQLECPTCYRKIVVPQPATESKFVLTASEANKPRPPQPTIPTLEPIRKKTSNLVPVMLIVLLIALGAAGAAVYAFRGKIFKSKNSRSAETQSASNEEANASRIITNNVPWSLDLSDTNFSFPETPVTGKIHGEFAQYNRNTLIVGALSFRQAMRATPDVSVTIHFTVTRPEDLGGRSINVATNDSAIPRVAIRWKEGSKTKTQWITNDYALRLETSPVIGNHLSGKIYLCLPDENQTRIAGTFIADIRKPAPPKPKSPKPKS